MDLMKDPSANFDGIGLPEIEKEQWEEAKEMHLMNTNIWELPENPNCPNLNLLSLQANHHLRVIPSFFFQSTPALQTLNLSQTKLKSLPQSLFQLAQLRKFILRGCELFKELPDEIGQLCHLEVLDLEGTEIINLPVTVQNLTKLTCLKVSFYCESNHNRKHPPSNGIIPRKFLSKLHQLKTLSIDVYPEDVRWIVTVEHVVLEICSLNKLHSLKLYLPEVKLLSDLFYTRSLMKKRPWMRFGLTVGSHLKSIILRLPQEVAVEYEKGKRCLKYVNGEDVPTEIKNVLHCATSLFLDRHFTVASLSKLGMENMKNLKFCVLKECNKIRTVVEDADHKNVLRSLEYLHLHYLKNVRSISTRPLGKGSLSCLKALKLYSCPQLTTIFTTDLLVLLGNLEELVVEDCPKIKSIVSQYCHSPGCSQQHCFLPNLKKIALHNMPKLVSLSRDAWIAPRLEWLSCYDCPNLKTLYPVEFTSHNLKVVIGEADWWSALQWNRSTEQFPPPNLDGIFVPTERDTDLTTQLAKINYQLQAIKRMQELEPSLQKRMQELEPSLQSGLDEISMAEIPMVEIPKAVGGCGFTLAVLLLKLKLLCNCFLCE